MNLNRDKIVSTAGEGILGNVHRAVLQAQIEGDFVQSMIPAKPVVILGVLQDFQFGVILMFGLGGVEVWRDVAFALAP